MNKTSTKNRRIPIHLILVLLVLLLPKSIFAQEDTRPHVVFIAGEEEYGAHWTLPKIADDLERRFNIKTTVIHSWRSGAHDYDMPGQVEIPEFEEIKGLEIIKEADLVVMHIRFRLCPPEQLQIFQDYFDAGKPAIAFRTTSHGMWAADQKDWFVPFFGGHYKGHSPNTEGTTTLVPAEQLDHPILRGVPKMRSWNDVMGIYITAPLNDTATPLMMGKTGLIGPAQPVTWINEYQKGQKIFYTSMGGLESFVDPGFLNMVYNAVYWALDKEIPENGVLNIHKLEQFEKEPPFEKYAFGALMENPFERPEADLALENAIIFDEDFTSTNNFPAPPVLDAPKNATILFDGSNISKWRHWDLSDKPVAMLPDARAVSPSPKFDGPRWNIVGNSLEVRPGFGSILTKENYGNYRLHIDFLIPEEPNYVPEKFKGSGSIFLDGQYEIKILDSYGKAPSKTSNGSIFNQVAPSSNPSKPVNQWQSLGIEYQHYKGQRPKISVRLNGTKIHDGVTILNRAPFAIREDIALYKSSKKDGTGKFNMNRDNWSTAIEFRTLNGGYLLTNAPDNQPWNENSKGLLLHEGRLIYRNGMEYQLLQETEESNSWNDGKWHEVWLSAKDGKIHCFVDGQLVKQMEHKGSTTIAGHVLRIGQATKRFRLGASDLPIPFRGETFDGEIRKVHFFNQAIDDALMSKLQNGQKIPKKICALEWQPNSSTNKTNIQKGPIRIQSDLSKIRYANIWLETL